MKIAAHLRGGATLRFLALLSLVLLPLWQPLCAQTLVVIVNPDSGIGQMSRDEAIAIFLGRQQRLPSGKTAMPIDLDAEREIFYSRLVGWRLPQIKSYWARLVFTGKASPPFQAPDAQTALQLVASNPSAIAYVDRAIVDQRVKVVFELNP